MRGLYLSMYRSAGDQQRLTPELRVDILNSIFLHLLYVEISDTLFMRFMCVFVPVFLLVRCTSRLIAEGLQCSRVRE